MSNNKYKWTGNAMSKGKKATTKNNNNDLQTTTQTTKD